MSATNYTDTQLKQALAKMLPTDLYYASDRGFCHYPSFRAVLNTELLHLCWLVECSIDDKDRSRYYIPDLQAFVESENWYPELATWQQRTIALAKVKGVEIV